MCKRKLKDLLAGFCLFAIASQVSPTSAADLSDTGTVTYSLTQITHIPLVGGKVLTEQRMAGVLVASDSAPPFHLSSQDCLSAGIGDGKGLPDEDNGVCVAVDKDGDAWWLSYVNKGEDRKWTVVSGTGKYAGMTGSGTTKLLAITPDGRMTISWRGEMKMK